VDQSLLMAQNILFPVDCKSDLDTLQNRHKLTYSHAMQEN
jgi:hypothetical protein